MSEGFHRCTHCRGFYEVTFERCKWCEYEAPQLEKSGEPKVYADREAVRAIQVAEYHALPAEAHADPMKPPAERLGKVCYCLHCGPAGHPFEAVEMRWIVNEHMWACPCTTCGGRGFEFDIHTVGKEWECAECGHYYTPEKFTSKYARCPKCGSTHANGWFDDENDEGEPMTDEEYEEYQAKIDAEVEAEMAAEEAAKGGSDESAKPDAAPIEEDVPWVDDVKPFDPANPDGDDDDFQIPSKPNKYIPDDIDFPNPGIPEERRHPTSESAGEDDDIPY